MKNVLKQIACIMMALAMIAAYAPLGLAWAVDGAPEGKTAEGAENASSAIIDEEDTDEAAGNTDTGSDVALTISNDDEKNDTAVEPAPSEPVSDPVMETAGSASESVLTVTPDIEHGTVTMDGICGTATPDDGYDLATVRQIWTDEEGAQHEQYLEYTDNYGNYIFEAIPDIDNSEITAFFFSLTKWDGAVDLTWYDPDMTEYEIGTPAQLAGLAAITNGMVDEAVTEEYMIKDNAGRSVKDGQYCHMYISTEPAEADLLTPNHMDGAGQVRDTVWRLPETEKDNKLAEDDLHHDFLYRTVMLTADIDMGDINWTPIGGKYAMNTDATGDEDPKVIDTRFQGIMDGCGHTVTITCDRRAAKGYAYAMEIAFIGYLGGGVDYRNGYPKDTYMDYAQFWVPTVRNLVIKGDIKGRRMVAGVVGRTGETNYGVLVEKCANYADVYATDMRGCAGVVGAAWGKAVIRDCYNSGTIRSNFWEHGGIVGSNGYEGSEGRPAAGADIYNCYNVGATGLVNKPDADPDYDGQEIGVDGQAFASYSVSNCYYPEPETPKENKTGYSIGDTSKNKKARITNVEAADIRSEDTLVKLNSNGEVFAEDTGNINNGYPVLYFQNGYGSGRATVTLKQTSGGTIESTSDLSDLAYGTTIELSAAPDKGKRLTGYKVSSDSDDITIPPTGFYTTTGKDVIIEGIFGDRAPSTLTFIENSDGAPYYVKVEKTYDGQTGTACEPAVELNSGDQVEVDDIIRITPVDINLVETQPDIKYLEYTGKFNDPVYPDWSLEVVNKQQKTYKVTGDVDVIDISVNPKTQGKRWTTVADTSWYRNGETSYTITTAGELAGLSKLCGDGNTFEGVTILLGNDISLENTYANSGDVYGYERSWTGIGASERYPFKGTFDGQGHTIRYMHRNFATGYCDGGNGGLFGVTDRAIIKNVIVEGGSYVNDDGVTMECSFINGANGGSIVGTAINTMIENCKGRLAMSKAFNCGGIAGSAEGNTVIRNCVSECSISGTNVSIGGIIGKIDGDGVQIVECTNNGPIETTSWQAGGILGSGESYSAVITRCVNNGPVKASMKGGFSNINAAGGIIGYAGGALTCSQCVNNGSVSGYGKTYALGGIAGTVIRGIIEDCVNRGTVYSESTSDGAQLAGIANVGTNRLMVATIRNSYNTGTVTKGAEFKTNNYGGAVGYGSASTNVFQNVYCTAEAAASIGGKAGIAGQIVSESDLRNLKVPLGDNFVPDINNVNGGFPVLAWQDPEAAEAAKKAEPPAVAPAVPAEPLLPAMKIKSAKNSKSKAAVIKWKRVKNAEGYQIMRSMSKNGKYKVIKTVKVTKKLKKKKTLDFTNKKLKKKKTYYFKIRYYKKVNGKRVYSELSAPKKVKIKK